MSSSLPRTAKLELKAKLKEELNKQLTDSSSNKENATQNDHTISTPTATPVPAQPIRVKQFTMDGYVLSEIGLKEIKKLLPEQQKKSRGKRSLKPSDADETINEDTSSLDASDSKEKKRQRRTNKIGIGGFLVKQRNRKEDETNSNNTSFDLNEMPNDADSNLAAPVSSEKPKRKRNKNKKNPLLNTYPPQLQDAFFGKSLLDDRKENAMGALDEKVGNSNRLVKFSRDQIIDLMSAVDSQSAGNRPNQNSLLNGAELTGGKPPKAGGSLPDGDPDLNNKVFEETLEDEDSLRDILSLQQELPEEEDLINMFDIDGDQMDTKDALDHLTMNAGGPPTNQQQQQEFSFLHQPSQLAATGQLTGSVPQQPQQNSIHSVSISNKSILEGSSFSNDSFSSTSSSFTSHNQSSGNLAASNQNSNSSDPNDPNDGESLSQNQKHSAKWKEDEPLNNLATISPVLYANIIHPGLKIEYPNWPERYKHISKIWRLLKPEERQPYLNKARENRTANRVQKDQNKQNNKEAGAQAVAGKDASYPPLGSNDLQQANAVTMQQGGLMDAGGYQANSQQPQQQLQQMNRAGPPMGHQMSAPFNLQQQQPQQQQPTMIQMPLQVSRVRVRAPIDPTRISLPNANKVQSPRSQNPQDSFTNQFTANSPFSPKPLNDSASPYAPPPPPHPSSGPPRQHSSQSPVGSFSPAHNSLSNEPFPSPPTRPIVNRQDSGNAPLTPNSCDPYSRSVPTTPIPMTAGQDACSNSTNNPADLYAQQPMTPTMDGRSGIRPPTTGSMSPAMSPMDPYSRPPLTPRPSHDPFSFHSPASAAPNNRVQPHFNPAVGNQRSPSFSPHMQSNSPDPYAQQPMTPMPNTGGGGGSGYDPYKQNKPMTPNLQQQQQQQDVSNQPGDAKRQLRDLLQKNQNQNQNQQCFRSPFPVDQMNNTRHRIVNPSNDQQVFRHPGDNLSNASRMMPPRGPMTMDIRNKVVINQPPNNQHIRYPPQQMSPSPGMPPQQQQLQQCSPMSPMSPQTNWNRMPAMQQPQHGNLIQQPKAPMPMQNAYPPQPFGNQQQFMNSHNSQMIYGGPQQSHLQNALQHPMKANDPNMSTAAISNQPSAAPANQSTSELIKQVQETDGLVDESLITDDVLGNEDDLMDFDEDFNILEYADPEPDKTVGKIGGQKSSIFDENFDELELDKEEELDKDKSKETLEGQQASVTGGSTHLPPPYSAAIQQQQQSSMGPRKNADGDLMNLLSDSDFEKLKSDLFDNDLSVQNPIGKLCVEL